MTRLPKILHRTWGTRVGVGIAGAFTIVAVAVAGGATIPTASGAGTGHTLQFTVKDTLTSFNVVDSNAKGWTPGDTTTFTHILRDLKGRKVGRADGDCVITRVAQGHPTAAECGETYRFADGWIQVNTLDLIRAREDAPVTGGIGRYQNMTGEARAGLQCGDCITFELRGP
jgi:hypothetical protein